MRILATSDNAREVLIEVGQSEQSFLPRPKQNGSSSLLSPPQSNGQRMLMEVNGERELRKSSADPPTPSATRQRKSIKRPF